MNNLLKTMTESEKLNLSLKNIYESFGYSLYKMSKFEEYDLYSSNKDFLMGGNVITFTDLNGKLMALKPDVTMSIIKNSSCEKDGSEKVYYSENVYRASRSGIFKEALQIGLESLGNVDTASVCEVISLATKSLELISGDYVLDISHMAILTEILDEATPLEETKKLLTKYISQKNRHDLIALANEENISEKSLSKLLALCDICSFDGLSAICEGEGSKSALEELKTVFNIVGEENLRIDFSLVQDMSYYNGIVFQGFIKGISDKVLSGGQYDKLCKRMGKPFGAIGFAVEPDLLQKLYPVPEKKKTAIIYDDSADLKTLFSLAEELRSNGESVIITKKLTDNGCIKAYDFKNGKLEEQNGLY